MIKNRNQLLKNISPDIKKRRSILLDIADYVLTEISPRKLFKKVFFKKNLSSFKHIAVISIGKAAKSMADAVLPLLPRKPDFILIAGSGHPLPTKEGVKNTEKIISVARDLQENDLAIVLISGGGSAMLVSPVPEITLADKIATTKALLKSGAEIQEINVIRKHLSQIKGGRLASLLYPATVFGFVISDVTPNDLGTIASGPLSPDPSTFADAISIIKKYKIRLPVRIKKYLEKGMRYPRLETPKAKEKYFKKVEIKIIADHKTVVKKAYEKAQKLGLRVRTIKTPLIGEARKVAVDVIARSEATKQSTRLLRYARNDITIASGETTVTCRGKGFGGRNQEFVLSALSYLKPHQTILSIGTDGVDGICPKEIAGAIGDRTIFENAQKKKLNIADFLRRNNSYNFFKKTGGHIVTGKTGTNLGDLMMCMVWKTI